MIFTTIRADGREGHAWSGGILCLSADVLATTIMLSQMRRGVKSFSSMIGKSHMLHACPPAWMLCHPSLLPRSRKMLTDTLSARVDQRPSAAVSEPPEGHSWTAAWRIAVQVSYVCRWPLIVFGSIQEPFKWAERTQEYIRLVLLIRACISMIGSVI